MNQRGEIDNQGRDWLSAAEAVRVLGVKRETLYAYASRGLVRSSPGPGGRARLYQRDDLERLRARSQARAGHAPVAAGALRWGEPVLETRVGDIRADGPYYRGRGAVELATRGAHFEEVCALLWDGPFVPGPDAKDLGAPASHLRALLPPNAEPLDGMMVAAAALAARGLRAEPSLAVARDGAALLVRRLVAAAALPRAVADVEASLASDRTARGLLRALGGKASRAAHVAAIDEALVLMADHELNASTFAARVAASAGSSLPACLMAALGAASGPLHGGATARVEALAREVARPERAAEVVKARLDRGESVPGFGHPLYPTGDPRGTRLLAVATTLGGDARGVRVLAAIASAMDLVARERMTVDVGLVALGAALGLGPGAPLAIFAAGRLAGWIAHALEQRADGFLLRPRARYVGS